MPNHKAQRALLTDNMYDRVRATTQYVVPGIGTLYFALSGIWGLPFGEEILGSMLAFNLFLGGVLGYSAKSYEESGAAYSGYIRTTPDGPKRLELDLTSEELADKDHVTLKIAN